MSDRPKSLSFFLLVLTSVWILFLFSGCNRDSKAESFLQMEPTYTGSVSCMACHQEAYTDWLQSDHYKAIQPANDSTVLGDFGNVTYTADGVTSRFFKKDEKFIIHTKGNDGQYHDFEVAFTFGFYPLQQYLVKFPGGRMQSARVSWDSRDNKWFHQYPDQEIHHKDWLHWTGASQNWNTMCASCHSTDLQKNYQIATDSFVTTWKELNVSCESCHGPGSTHIEYMQAKAEGATFHLENSGLRYARDTTPQIQLNTCAACHARKSDVSPDLLHTYEIMDDLIPQVITDEYYFADGQIMEEDYEYGSFTQSKMFHSNVHCSSCHNPHSGKVRKEGNALCLTCHTPNYNTPQHHFHSPESTGAQCVNCHMVTRTYMGNDHRRDHSFRIPRPDQSVVYDTPNACTQCHKDQTDQWAADQVVEWYGPKRAYHFSDDLLPGSALGEEAESHLSALLRDTLQPAIARATAVNYLGRIQTMGSLEQVLWATADKHAIVRYQALRSLENFPEDLWSQKVGTLLRDPVRAVRIAAADLYHRVAPDRIPKEEKEAYASADQENRLFLEYQADFSVGNVMIADYALQEGDFDRAIMFYRRGLKKDSLMNYARLNLATVYNIIGRNEQALDALRQAAQIDPFNDRIHYNLALLYFEMGNTKAALEAFQAAVGLASANPSVYYNYGLLLQREEMSDNAERIYLRGLQLDPGSINILYALTLFYLEQGNPDAAKVHGTRLKASDPYNPDFQELFYQLGI